MKTRFLTFNIILIGVLTIVCSCSNPSANTEHPLTKPNVLFIAVDDLRSDLGCYGNSLVKSPNIDRLSQEGLTFERTYCQMPICMASRSSILSGYRPDTYQGYFNGPLFVLDSNALSLNQHFKNNGYNTIGLGKIYHHKSDLKEGWSKPFFAPKEGVWQDSVYQGQWYGRGYMGEEAQAIAREYDINNNSTAGRGPAFEIADVADSLYIDGVIAQQALKELRNMEKDQPFFLAVGFIKPHLPFVAPKKYWDLYDEADISLADNPYVPQDAPELAFTKWKELRNYYGMPGEGPVPDSLAKKLVHGYYACISFTDALIGRVLDELDKQGLRENTIVVLWSDHGWKLGEHSMWCKHTTYELDARVPFIISTPEMKTKGKNTMALTELVDVYPTLCELAGIELPAHLEGKSMVPLLDNPDLNWKEAVFTQFPSGDHSWGRHKRKNCPVEVMGYSMKTDRYRYTEWIKMEDGTIEARELYDHQTDADENKNVADAPENQELVNQLSKMLHEGYVDAKSI